MRYIPIFTLGALLVAGTAHAIENLPASCHSPTGQAAKLQCDLDRADQVAERSDDIYGYTAKPIVRIVDTDSPSGSAYVYDIVDANGTLLLDARSVPESTAGGSAPIPACRLQRQLPDNVANKVALSLLFAAEPAVPAYGKREKMVINADGSRSYELLLTSHDIITRIETVDGMRDFSRHAEATDKIADLNRSVIGVANFSDGWVCKTN